MSILKYISDYLSMLWFTLIHVSERGPRCRVIFLNETVERDKYVKSNLRAGGGGSGGGGGGGRWWREVVEGRGEGEGEGGGGEVSV